MARWMLYTLYIDYSPGNRKMNATANTCIALRDLLNGLVVSIGRDFQALEITSRILHNPERSTPNYRDTDTDISLVSEIANYERDINEGGASAEAVKTALIVLNGYNASAADAHAAIWAMRDKAWRLNSAADQVLWVEDI